MHVLMFQDLGAGRAAVLLRCCCACAVVVLLSCWCVAGAAVLLRVGHLVCAGKISDTLPSMGKTGG